MPKISAGLLIYHRRGMKLHVLLVHPGGPFFRNKDDGSWSIPKGEINPNEQLLEAARREVEEEVGFYFCGNFRELEPIRQAGGKIVYAWANEAEIDTHTIKSNTFRMQWPPKSGKEQEFPEVDRAEYFDLQMARKKILASQLPLLDQLSALLK